MGAACVRPVQSNPFVGNQNAYQVQPLRNGRTPSSSRSGNQNLSLTQDGRDVGRLREEGQRNQNIKIVVPIQQRQQEQQLKQQEQQQQRQHQEQQQQQQQREQQQQRLEQEQRQQQEQQQLQQQQTQQQDQEQEQQLQREQQQQQDQEQEQQQLQQEQQQQQVQEQEQQQLQQEQPQPQFQPVTEAGSLDQTYELSHNLKSNTDRVPATDCYNETQVDSPKELKRCDSLIDDDNYCPTCFYGYETDNPKIPTKCHHHYHLACILEWMERSNTCPVCDQEMIILQM